MTKHAGYHCVRCYSIFPTDDELAQHEQEYQTTLGMLEDDRLSCGECGKKFRSNCQLQRHGYSHQEHNCKICVKKFSNKDELDKHALEHKDQIISFPCPTCHRTFETIEMMRYHQAIHKIILCGICGISVTRPNFKDHMTKHNNSSFKPFKCITCQKSFRNKNLLSMHRRIHIKERLFACDFEGCTMKFKTSSGRDSHRKRHLEKTFKCTYDDCNRKFHGKFDFELHMRRHIGEKPFECTGGCNERFYTMSLLRKHQESCVFIDKVKG